MQTWGRYARPRMTVRGKITIRALTVSSFYGVYEAGAAIETRDIRAWVITQAAGTGNIILHIRLREKGFSCPKRF